MISLPFSRYRFHCRAVTPVSFPQYAGSTWRGAFGHALKHTVCVTQMPQCSACLLWRTCAYSEIFETPPPEDAPLVANYPAAPHPFIIHPEATNGGDYQPGDTFSVDLTLIGRTAAQLPYVVHAWRQMGDKGVGRGRGHYQVVGIDQLTGDGWRPIYRPGGELTPQPPLAPAPPPAPEGDCRLVIETPLRIRHGERLMGPAAFRFRGLVASLLRRLSLLHHFLGGGPLEVDFRDLVARADTVVPKESDLGWYDWQRYSNRQRTAMKMGGLTGWLTFAADDVRPFWPWLALGRWLHVGKGVSMGLGRYRIETA